MRNQFDRRHRCPGHGTLLNPLPCPWPRCPFGLRMPTVVVAEVEDLPLDWTSRTGASVLGVKKTEYRRVERVDPVEGTSSWEWVANRTESPR